MLKRFIASVLACAVCMGVSVSAQESDANETYKVAVGSFSYTPKKEKKGIGHTLGVIATSLLTGQTTQQQAQYADAVRANIISGLSHVVRFRVVEAGQDMGELHHFYVDGVISDIATTTQVEPNKEKGKPDIVRYKALVDVTVNLKDVVTGEVIDSRMFGVTESDCSWVPTTEKAVENALRHLASNIALHYNGTFPLTGSIIESAAVKNDKQKSVYIDLGASFGLYKGLKFIVYSMKTVAGKEARIEIGRLKVEKVLGDELSECKVSKGDKALKTAMDNGETLIVVSRF